MKILAFLLSMAALFGQAGPGLLNPRASKPTINYYVATSGNNSNVCSSASKCLTVAHVLALLPQVLDRPYVINVADGTYAEGLDITGFVGTGSFGSTYANSITILGNTGTPANVVFTGTVTCDVTSGACVNGSAVVNLSGIKVAPTSSQNGISCHGGFMALSNVLVAGSTADGIEALDCFYTLSNTVTISGYAPVAPPSDGIGIYNAHGSVGLLLSGTTTITGPGGTSTVALGLVLEFQAQFTILGGSTNLTITGVQQGILVNVGGFDSYVSAGTISVTNSATVTASSGITTCCGGSFNVTGTALTVDHFTTCLLASANSVMDHGNAARTLTNCGTTSSAIQGSQIILF